MVKFGPLALKEDWMRVRVFLEAQWWSYKDLLIIPYEYHRDRNIAVQFCALFYKDVELSFEPQKEDVVDVDYPQHKEKNHRLVVFKREWVLERRPILFVEITVVGSFATACEIDPKKMKTAGWKILEDSLRWSTWDSRLRIGHWEDRPYKNGEYYDPRGT